MSFKDASRILLNEDQMPKQWLNIVADMPEKLDPYINPATKKPATKEDFYPIFAKDLVDQEFSQEPFIDIPEEILDIYKMYRPSPLIRAKNLEKALGTPAKIYFKHEGLNTSGSHKLNSAVPQVYYNKMQGIKNLTTETGAGQWGTALAVAAAFYDMPLSVYMVKISAEQKPYRKAIMETFGAKVIKSPSDTTKAGRKILSEDPECPGSLGCAISEAVEVALNTPDTRYVLGSVLNQVVLHQSIIGLEAKKQMEIAGLYPDIVIGCAGGGSNLGGIMSAFMKDKLNKKANPYFIAAEPSACPSLTRGKYAYDFCDMSNITPLAKMYTLGSTFLPSAIHSGGLRYHGMSPILSKLYHDGYLDEARALSQRSVFEAAQLFAKHETILPAPESAHAIKTAIDEALKCKESGEAKVILFNLTGHGNFDMGAYMKYIENNIVDYSPSDEELQKGFDLLPDIS
ncbi:MAG: TrpB-like pyridoxal phosphate-dependent enzyme [Clostridiales bacterium]|jgi:tryptophan synthase beta chain|nr:TrpB-like pyridoxal phosphate-dependent enzyme [Clostridiales bacterium]